MFALRFFGGVIVQNLFETPAKQRRTPKSLVKKKMYQRWRCHKIQIKELETRKKSMPQINLTLETFATSVPDKNKIVIDLEGGGAMVIHFDDGELAILHAQISNTLISGTTKSKSTTTGGPNNFLDPHRQEDSSAADSSIETGSDSEPEENRLHEYMGSLDIDNDSYEQIGTQQL